MHLHADDLDVAQFRCALVNCGKLVKRDAKLVLARAGRNVFVRVRIDIGVSTQSDRRTQIFRDCDSADMFQLRFTLNVEAVNALLERELNLLTRLAHPGERATRRINPGCYHTIKLAAGNDVEAGAGLCQQLQDRASRVRFDRVTNQVIKRRQRRIEPRIVIENCSRTVNVKWRAKFLGHDCKIDIFAIEMPFAITKKMHGNTVAASLCEAQRATRRSSVQY